jgi:hypothetical protein
VPRLRRIEDEEEEDENEKSGLRKGRGIVNVKVL